MVYLVRSLGLMPESVSHDWHVQPSCQRPNRGPPKRREFSPGGVARMRNRLSSKLYKHTCSVKSCQSTHPTGFPDVFHKWTVMGGGRRAAGKNRDSSLRFGMTRSLRGAQTRNSMAFRSGRRHFRRMLFATARIGRQKIEKRSFWRSLL